MAQDVARLMSTAASPASKIGGGETPKALRRLRRNWGWRGLWTLVALVALHQGCLLASVIRLRTEDPASTSMMRAYLDEDGGSRIDRRWRPLSEISPHLVRAVIAGEDHDFVRHRGVDWAAVRAAYEANAEHGSVVRGGSTITQQLAKNLFLSPRQSYARKAQEAILAYELEAFLGKRRIMELYLNVIEWDEGIYGAEAASQHYLGRSARDLTPSQAAYLAAIIPGPRRALNPRHDPERHSKARRRIT